MNQNSTRHSGSADQRVLSLAARFVPVTDRADWVRSWTAELWHSRHLARGPQSGSPSKKLYAGLLRDALWLRAESCKRALRGTPMLCLLGLCGLCLLAGACGVAFFGGIAALRLALMQQSSQFGVSAALVVLVTWALAPSIPVPGERHKKVLPWIWRKAFLSAKICLLLLLTLVLSADICEPLSLLLPVTAAYFQVFSFVMMALLALRWAFLDQGQRCAHCLGLLAAPVRVGRPSHNLLERNGTELACRKGHGLLSVPELETCWRSSSEWVHDQTRSLAG